MRAFTLAIAWNWEFDQDFIAGIERECASRGVTTYLIDPSNLHQTLKDLRDGFITFSAFYDRASDADPEFLPLVDLLAKPDVYCINPHDRVVQAIDKAGMHLEFITHGVNVPNTLILPPFSRNGLIDVPAKQLDEIGRPFVIKPANTTGGGTGVVLGATTAAEVIEARQQHKDDKYLVQETIVPALLGGKRAWFRVYAVFDQIIPCWWDDRTHMYSVLSPENERQYNLGELRRIMGVIKRVSNIDFFSSEIAMTEGRKFVVVDYVNEVCDMRLQSKYINGAPDDIVHSIERLIAEEVAKHVRKEDPPASAPPA